MTAARPGGDRKQIMAAAAGCTVALAMAGPSRAQTWVGANIEGGLHWHVSAPQGARWRLECRFPPVTYYRSAYEQKAWINRFERSGQGADSGRLPLNSGHCNVWKTGGRGPVAIGLARTGETVADATRNPAEPARAGFF